MMMISTEEVEEEASLTRASRSMLLLVRRVSNREEATIMASSVTVRTHAHREAVPGSSQEVAEVAAEGAVEVVAGAVSVESPEAVATSGIDAELIN